MEKLMKLKGWKFYVWPAKGLLAVHKCGDEYGIRDVDTQGVELWNDIINHVC
jgi:hypothetical protein